jgi:hypothetical protein
MMDCIHDWSFINKHVEGTPYVPLFKCDKCAEVLEDWDAADYISHLENLLEERDALIARLIVTGRPLADRVVIYAEDAGHVLPKLEAESWRKVVAEYKATNGEYNDDNTN